MLSILLKGPSSVKAIVLLNTMAMMLPVRFAPCTGDSAKTIVLVIWEETTQGFVSYADVCNWSFPLNL